MSWQEVTTEAVWLLELQVAGAVYRFADQAVEVEGYLYNSGLSDLTVGEAGAADQSVPIELVTQVDWAGLEAEGYTIERAPVVLKRYREGAAAVWVQGLAIGAAYAEKGQPLTFDLASDAAVDDSEILDPRAVIDTTTHPKAGAPFEVPDGSIGNRYPLIIGCPGHDPSSPRPRPAVPSWLVQWDPTASPPSNADLMLFAAGGIHATNCQAWNMTTGATEQRAAGPRQDVLNQDYTGHSWTLNTIYTDSANDYAIGLQDDATFGGGVSNPYRPGRPLRAAGDVVRYVLEQVEGMQVDQGRLEAFLPWLNRFQVDTYITQQLTWWDWLESAVLAWLPVQTVRGPLGLYFAPVRWDLTPADVVAYLDADRRQVQRVGALQRLRQDVYNEITVNYRPRLGGGYYTSRTLTARNGQLSRGVAVADDARIRGDYLAQRSQSVYGVRALSVDLEHSWDDATADEVAQQLMYRHAWHKRLVSYEGGPELEALTVGDCVAVTESAVSLREALARVVDIRPRREGCTVDLVLLDSVLDATS